VLDKNLHNLGGQPFSGKAGWLTGRYNLIVANPPPLASG
jgi:hypothetical protein